MSPSGDPSCTDMVVPITVQLRGGVTSAAVSEPSVGSLLRLSLACYLGLPAARVAIVSITGGAQELDVGAADPVNSVDGSCSASPMPSPRPQQRALRPVEVEPSSDRARVDLSRARDLGQSGELTTVTLVALAAACATDTDQASKPALAAQLVGLLATLPNATATTGGVTLLGAFLAAAADASGVSNMTVTASASAGTPSLARLASKDPTAQGSTFPMVPVVAAAGGALLLLLLALLLLTLRRKERSNARAQMRASGSMKSWPGQVGVTTNPMHHRGGRTLVGGATPRPLHLLESNARARSASVNPDTGASLANEDRQRRRVSVKTSFGQRLASAHDSNPTGAAYEMQANPIHARAGREALSPPPAGAGDIGHQSPVGDDPLTMTSNPMLHATVPSSALLTSESQLLQSAATYSNKQVVVDAGQGRRRRAPDVRAGIHSSRGPLDVRAAASMSSASAVSE